MLIIERSAELRHTSLTPDGDSFKMRVPVLQADEKNANRRTYPFAVVRAAIEDLKSKLTKRSAFGSTKHETALEVDAVSHVIESIELDEKGLASAIIRIFNTARGKNLASIIRGGGRLGISARGEGSVKEGVVQPGYRLLGLDFCLDPSFGFTAGKETMVFESRSEEDDGAVTEKELEEFGLEPMLTKEQLADRYLGALAAGYRGDFESYRKLFEKKG